MGIAVRDFGGKNYKFNPPAFRQSFCTVQCLDCGTRRLLTRNDIDRRSKPHCLKCGGPVEEVKASRKRRGVSSDKFEREKVFRCAGCGKSLGGLVIIKVLCAHLMNSLACRREYQDLGYVTGGGVIVPTLHIHETSTAWKVKCVDMSGNLIVLHQYRELEQAEKRIELYREVQARALCER